MFLNVEMVFNKNRSFLFNMIKALEQEDKILQKITRSSFLEFHPSF